jgi:alpha-L-arabinofuranosidase
MYAPHQGAAALRTRIETPEIRFQKRNVLQATWQSALQKGEQMEGHIPTVTGSASLKDQTVFLTLANSHAAESAAVTVDVLGGMQMDRAEGQVLSGEIHAHNTFDAPNRVTPQQFAVDCEPTQVHLTLPPASVAAIKVHLLSKS